MRWQIVRELGVQYTPPGAPSPVTLEYPVLAERAADGSTLIVDKVGTDKALPFWLEYRTLRVARDGRVLFDSRALGADDAFGCLMRDGGCALLRIARWEVQLLSPAGDCRRTLSLAAISKRPPMLIASTERDTLLLAFVDRLFEVELYEIDLDGALLWHLPAGAYRFGCPSSLQRLPNDHLLVADEFCSTATEIDRRGAVVTQFGKAKDPSRRLDRLSNPHFTWQAADGERLVADTRNHRVLSVRDGSAHVAVEPRDTSLTCPTSAVRVDGGRLLVCDAGHRRVVELDADGRVAWQFGDEGIGEHALSFPRSVEMTPDGGCLIADTANDRVVVQRGAQTHVWPTLGAAQLFWPRCARITPAGTLLVADGRNSRVVEVSPDGQLLNELRAVELEGGLSLSDPHDARLLADGTVLVTDASIDLVAIVRWSGAVRWAAGRGHGPALKDPHSAQPLADGSMLICDTGNSRVVRVDAQSRVVDERETLSCGPVRYRFNRPRYAEIGAGGWLVVDTGNNRILGADAAGESAWELARLPASPTPWINQPRWAHWLGDSELLVTDHLHHRVLHLRRG